VCAVLLYLTDRTAPSRCRSAAGARSTRLGPLGITLVVDRLSALMLVVSAVVLLAVVFYAIGQGIRDGDERQPVSIFLPTYLVLSAACATRSWPVICSTCSSASRSCCRPVSCC
jgi:multicomponent Na+:H+ antiporter subunit D